MKFELLSGTNEFTVVLLETTDNKRLSIKYLELEDPMLLSRESVETEIKKRVTEYFDCDRVLLEMDRSTEKKIYSIVLNNKRAFEAK